MNTSKSGSINFPEFKASLEHLSLIGRIKDIFIEISNLDIDNESNA